jgi:hypothetical protein
MLAAIRLVCRLLQVRVRVQGQGQVRVRVLAGRRLRLRVPVPRTRVWRLGLAGIEFQTKRSSSRIRQKALALRAQLEWQALPLAQALRV